jgi:hypothetical protein
MTTPVSLPTGDVVPFVGSSAALSPRPAVPQGKSVSDSANDPSPAPIRAGKGDAPGAIKAPVQTRLTIEEIGNTGRFIYKFLNPVTGEVVQQLPREQVLKLSETDTYASGAMLNTQV